MQGLSDGNHGVVHSGGMPGRTYQQQHQLYQEVYGATKELLQVIMENESEESTQAVANFILEFRFSDGTDISGWMPPTFSEDLMKGKMLEALAHWIQGKARCLDQMVPLAQAGSGYVVEAVRGCKRQLEQACHQSPRNQILVEFIYAVTVELVGRDAACLGSALGGILVQEVNRDTLAMAEWPSILLSLLVRKLEEMQAKVSKVVMELYHLAGHMEYDNSKNQMMMFFQYYTVQTESGTLDVHGTCDDPTFRASPFRVNLITSFGCLMKLLCHLEDLRAANGSEVAVAVDFEGVKLCRNGQLCLVQMTCSDDPELVYVLDVFVLGMRAFTMPTPQGTSMKGVLEEDGIRKVWFDPRNDVDALYHQFRIMPRNVFDLQLAEVADRRKRGLNVSYVQGLYKCLTMCSSLRPEQKVFAERINSLGKRLFEPQNGGDYEIFRRRPLNPVILVYAAHDTRYMLVLYQQYVQSIGTQWVQRVLEGGSQRVQWCLAEQYVGPGTEAPDF